MSTTSIKVILYLFLIVTLISGLFLSSACNNESAPKLPLGRILNTVGNYQNSESDEEDGLIPGPESGWPEGYIKYFHIAKVTNVGDDGSCTFTAIIEGNVRGDKSLVQNIYLKNGEEKEVAYWWFVKGEIASINVVAVNLTDLP